MTETMRHSQARWFAMNVIEAGPDLPSRRKWAGLHRLARDFLELLEADTKMATENVQHPEIKSEEIARVIKNTA